MLINNSSSSGGSLSSMLSSSGLSSLASLAGVSASGGATYSALAVYITQTDSFLDSVNDKFDFSNRYKITTNKKSTIRTILKKLIKAEFDAETGILSVEFSDTDPAFAQSVVNYCVFLIETRFKELGIDKNQLARENLELNLTNSFNEIKRLENDNQKLGNSINLGRGLAGGESYALEATRIKLELEAQKAVYTQLKTQYELVKVKMASESPIFQILENAEIPEQKAGPSRGKLCIIVTFVAFFFSICLAFILNAISAIKKDPTAMAKLHGAKK